MMMLWVARMSASFVRAGTGSASLFIDGVLQQTVAYRATVPYAGFYNGLAVAAHKSGSRKPLEGIIDDVVSQVLIRQRRAFLACCEPMRGCCSESGGEVRGRLALDTLYISGEGGAGRGASGGGRARRMRARSISSGGVRWRFPAGACVQPLFLLSFPSLLYRLAAAAGFARTHARDYDRRSTTGRCRRASCSSRRRCR